MLAANNLSELTDLDAARANLELGAPLNVKWFGAVGDNVTDDSAAFQAALDFIFANRLTTAFGYAWGGSGLFIPKGRYYLGNHSLFLYSSIHLFGEGSGYLSASSVLRFDAGCDGIVVETASTSGSTGAVATGPAGGTIIEKLGLEGGYAGVEGDWHGIRLRGTAIVRDCGVIGFPGNGIHGEAAAGAGGALEGNFNCSHIAYCFVQGNRAGISLKGADSNACTIIGCNAIANRTWGFYDDSFLGNFYYGCHAAANGWDGAATSTPTATTYGGNRYYVKPGQAAGASINAPTGTTADNTWWGYIGPGGTYNGIVAWVSGTTFREGGAYCVDPAAVSNRSKIDGCYSESDQNPSQFAQNVLVVGGLLASGIHGGGYAGGSNNRVSLSETEVSTALHATNVQVNEAGVAGSVGLFFHNAAGITQYSGVGSGTFLVSTVGYDTGAGSGPQISIYAGSTTGTPKRLQLISDKLDWIWVTDGLRYFTVDNVGATITGNITATGNASFSGTVAGGDATFGALTALGSEKIVNGDFASGANWSATGGWTISGGQAVATGAGDRLLQSGILTVGRTYTFKLTMTGSAGVAFRIRNNIGGANVYSGSIGLPQLKTGTFVADGPDFMIEASDALFTGTVDNVSVKEVISIASLGDPVAAARMPALTGDVTTVAGTVATTVTGAPNATAALLTSAGGVGYRAGAGGTVVQATSKSTAVTLNKLTGEITMNAAALAAGAIATFVLNNSQIAAGDMLVLSHHSGGTIGPYLLNGRVTGAGAASIAVRNTSAGSLSEAVVIKFAVIKTVTA
jgi:hypothetical protein